MNNKRQVYLAHVKDTTIGFEYPNEAEDYARAQGGTWSTCWIYLAGQKPKSWTLYTAEATVGGPQDSAPTFGEYQTSDIEGTPQESEPVLLMFDSGPSRIWARATGTDEELVRKSIKSWYAAARS